MTSHSPSSVPIPRRLAASIFISIASVYLATLTWDYYWDGITFALQIEKVARADARVALLFHQNHLLYNALGYLAYCALTAVGLGVRALYLLQVANALIGAGAILIFFRIALRATHSLYVAIVCTAFLAFSAAWWKISTDTNAYIATILLILVVANNLLGERPRWFVAGLALAGAMLIHELASLFYPAALAAVFSSRSIDRKTRFAVSMSALAWTVTIVCYYLCAYLMQGLTKPVDVLKWAVSNPSLQPVSSNPVEGILGFPKINVDAILGHNFALFRRQADWIEIAIALAAFIASVIFVITAIRKVDVICAARALRRCAPKLNEERKQITLMLIAWIGTYVLFLLFWGPLIYYRAFYVPAISLGLGLVLSNYHRATRAQPSGAAAYAVVAFALFNLAFYIGPNMRSDANVQVAAARNAGKVWNEKTVIYCANRTEIDTAFEYFNPSPGWKNVSRLTLDELESEIVRTYNQGGSLWLNRGAVSRVGREWLARHTTNEWIEVDSADDPAEYVRVSPDK